MKKASRSDNLVHHEKTVRPVRQWVETLVVGMNLCPFAKREMLKNRVRFATTTSITEEQLLTALQVELELLNTDPSVETTLLIHSGVLQDFYEGIYQIASFHPDYQFDGTKPDDTENYTNRSPYPMLHLIREASLERVIEDYQVDQIPARNIALMNDLGQDKLQALLRSCFNDSGQ
jgi:hypothetical protein